ncbi:hypothetical protein F66182_3794 [Fusarium sp. NRRL 66182]|nr:hypothetical protein F66182_3794 [Fusarium sp. NRRL 66182]
MLFTKIYLFAFATCAAAVAIHVPSDKLALDTKEPAFWPEFHKHPAPGEKPDTKPPVKGSPSNGTLLLKRQQEEESPERKANRAKVEAEIDDLVQNHKTNHEEQNRRELRVCPSNRCSVCAGALTATYVAAVAVCGTAAATEEAISAGALTPIAIAQLTACVGGAHAAYVGGWTFCIGMKD